MQHQNSGTFVWEYFFIHLSFPIDNVDDMLRMPPAQQATIFHEYIHYLQNLVVPLNIEMIAHKLKCLRLYLHEIATSDESMIAIPLPLTKRADAGDENLRTREFLDCIFENQFYCYEAKESIFAVRDICQSLEEEFPSWIPYEILEGQKVIRAACKTGRKTIPLILNTWCIEENMACLLEHRLFHNENHLPEYPYRYCDWLCSQDIPAFSAEEWRIAALCEASLSSQHPPVCFYNIMQAIKSKAFLPDSLDAFRTFLDENHLLVEFHDNGFWKNLEQEIFDEISIIFPKNLHEDIKRTAQCLMDVFQKAECMRRLDMFYFTRRIYCDRREPAEVFHHLLKIFSLPPVLDSNQSIWGTPDTPFFRVLLILKAFYEIFHLSKLGSKEHPFQCALYEICQKERGALFSDEVCRNMPWKQTERQKLCLFAAYWYHFSLDGKNLYIKM